MPLGRHPAATEAGIVAARRFFPASDGPRIESGVQRIGAAAIGAAAIGAAKNRDCGEGAAAIGRSTEHPEPPRRPQTQVARPRRGPGAPSPIAPPRPAGAARSAPGRKGPLEVQSRSEGGPKPVRIGHPDASASIRSQPPELPRIASSEPSRSSGAPFFPTYLATSAAGGPSKKGRGHERRSPCPRIPPGCPKASRPRRSAEALRSPSRPAPSPCGGRAGSEPSSGSPSAARHVVLFVCLGARRVPHMPPLIEPASTRDEVEPGSARPSPVRPAR
jgi:hypothetical protein